MNEKVEVVDDSQKTFSDDKALNKKLKIIFIIVIVVAVIWKLIIQPYTSFKSNESIFTKAAKDYFFSYSNKLPTGERVSEVSLDELYKKGFLSEDLYVPYRLLSKKTCSVTNSWVKVKKDGDDYKYYTYLKCGILQSSVDHKGPRITLKGEKETTISLGDEYKDAGVKSVDDNGDGKIDVKKVTTQGKVDTTKIGSYKITFIASDSLNNKTTVVRKVNVVQKLNSTIKKATDGTGYYAGLNPNNYIYFSGNLFRIVDIDGDNVRIVAEKDVSNVNHDGLDKWLDYYYDHLAESSKKLMVKNRYCQMTISNESTNTTECSSYTKERYVYIPSIVDVNKAQTNEGNFMKPVTMSWVADKADEKNAYLTRNVFYNEYYGASFMSYNKELNFGVRPMLTITKDIIIKSGDGTKANPYNIDDVERGKPDDYVNTRLSGEYLSINRNIYRIVDVMKDGTVKVIADFTLHEGSAFLRVATYSEDDTTYNLNSTGNIGYKINNSASEYIKTNYFVNHETEVPIYDNLAKYGNESKKEKVKAKIVAPNMYELYSASSVSHDERSYWYINSSKNKKYKYGVSDIGASITEEGTPYMELGIKPAAYLNKNCSIVEGSGTESDPYVVTK